MAKMVKCPTCGTQIEVPAQPAGQVIKCPGCGKGLKLVVKKPAGAGPAASAPIAPGAGAGAPVAPAARAPHGTHGPGGTIGGGSIAAMTFTGAEPPADDMPALDATCAVCGRLTDPTELVEANGKLVCRDCIKGARSKIERPGEAPEMLGFKAAAYQPVRRVNLIQIAPITLVGALAAVV